MKHSWLLQKEKVGKIRLFICHLLSSNNTFYSFNHEFQPQKNFSLILKYFQSNICKMTLPKALKKIQSTKFSSSK